MEYVLGIDLGTSSLKGILINEQGEVVAESSYDYPISTPKIGYSEQDPNLWIDAVKKVMNMPSYQEFFSSFDWPWFMPKKEDYVVLVEKTGFKQFDVSYENADRYFSRDEMIKWIDQPSIVPFLNCIPENKKKSFRNTVVEMMIDKTTQADGSCFETFRRINIKAMK